MFLLYVFAVFCAILVVLWTIWLSASLISSIIFTIETDLNRRRDKLKEMRASEIRAKEFKASVDKAVAEQVLLESYVSGEHGSKPPNGP